VRVAAVTPDLLFGSKVRELLVAAGHEVTPASAAGGGPGADVVVVDLASGVVDPAAVDAGGAPRLGVYAHVDTAMRERAQAAGFELVVPRSRFMREGAALVESLGSDAR
jgi:hypothetical protein